MTARMVFPDGAGNAIREQLFDPTMSYPGDDWGRDVLEPWTAANLPILGALRQLGEPQMATVALDAEDLWTLYAISRVAELLILPHQPASRNPDQPADWLPRTAHQQFLTAVGATFPKVGAFHPFLHEIVVVEPADDPTTAPATAGLWWPGCMIGSLMLVRAGVTIRAGVEQLNPAVAAGSTLYWAWRRRHRPAADVSHGWGSNSQWRTEFRRDYWLGDRLAYNVDAALDPTPEHPGGMPYNRDLDLLRHRCSTMTDHGDEQWVWHHHHTEPAPNWGTALPASDAVAEITPFRGS
jgi:hypothetical protein